MLRKKLEIYWGQSEEEYIILGPGGDVKYRGSHNKVLTVATADLSPHP